MKEVMGSRQSVRLPFKCEPTIAKWEVLYFNDKNKQLCSEVVKIQKFGALCVELLNFQELDQTEGTTRDLRNSDNDDSNDYESNSEADLTLQKEEIGWWL